jgi:hypothetical protein
MGNCPSCNAQVGAEVFPAALRDPVAEARQSENVSTPEEASCFYHPAKRAVETCANCGRFMCALCDVELSGEHICPSCLSTGRKKGRIRNLENERVLYGNVALALAILPILTIWFTIFTAPIAIYMAVRYWKAPQSLVSGGGKTKLGIAFTLGVIQVLAWIAGITYAISTR